MKIELFLDDSPVEINKDIDFVLNKQFTDLTDLTTIIVDYSKTIKVPMTPMNNELFNYVYKLDHQVLGGEEVVSYDPSQKINMTMTYNGSQVMEGYAVLNSVNLKDKTYEINLYGQLGKIFSDLKDKPLKDYIKGTNGWFQDVTMGIDAVSQSIENDHMESEDWLDWNQTDWTYFFGFAPQLIGKSDLIDTKTYEEFRNPELLDIEEDINISRSGSKDGWCAGAYVKDGLDFNQYPEMRSYMCRPYVYANKLIQLVQNEISRGNYDGYVLNLDPDWFNADNPYYQLLCYFPGQECIVDSGDGESVNGSLIFDNSEEELRFPNEFRPNADSSGLDGYTYSYDGFLNILTSTSGTESASLTLKADGVIVRDRVTGVGNTDGFVENGRWAFYRLTVPYIVPVRYLGILDSDGNLLYKLYLCDNEIVSIDDIWWGKQIFKDVWNTLKKTDVRVVVPDSTAWANSAVSNQYCEVTQVYNFGNIVLNTNRFKFKMGCDRINFISGQVEAYDVSDTTWSPLCPYKNSKFKRKLWNSGATWESFYMPVQVLEVSSNNFRSGSLWTVQDILGYDFNPFDWLLDYCKKFRLYFDIDYISKTITLKSGYFDAVNYKEVTVDYSKGMTVEPLVEKYNKVTYGYREDQSRKGIKYYKNNGVQYGDMNVNTNITVNNEVLELTPDEEEGVFIPTVQSAITYDNLMDSTQPISYQNILMTNKLISTLDGEGKVDYFPFYTFRVNNLTAGSTVFWWLSDDTPSQKNTGSYCYLKGIDWTRPQGGVIYKKGMSKICQFDNYVERPVIQDGVIHNYLWWVTFGVPKEVYNGYIPNNIESNSVYTHRWQKWLNELFNVHNKKVTCYIRMSYPEFISFKFNQLVVIDHSVFLVNKIIDFNPNEISATRVELIQISDVDNLK